MTQVYNKDNKILIYNTDCNAMLDKMNETGMKVDCIVTDPLTPQQVGVTQVIPVECCKNLST